MSTTIITRLYPDATTADAVRAALLEAGQQPQTIDVIDQSGPAGAKSARERLREAGVGSATADAYGEGVKGGKALVVVRAPFVPFGTALDAIRVVDEFPSLDVGVEDQNLYVRDEPRHASTLRVLTSNPLFLTSRTATDAERSKTVSSRFGLRLLTEDRPHHSAIRGGGFMSKKFLPFPLLTRDRPRNSAIRGGGFMSTKILPFPLLTRNRQPDSVIHGGGTPLSTMMGWPLLSGWR